MSQNGPQTLITDAECRDEQAIIASLLSESEERQERATVARLVAETGHAPRHTYDLTPRPVEHDPVVWQIGDIRVPSGGPSAVSFAQTRRVESLTRSDLQELARSSPELLVSYIASGSLRPAQLTFAAETLGDISDAVTAERALLQLSEHGSALVREGVVYGLAKLHSPAVKAHLGRLAADDPSDGVREAAADVLGI